MTPHGDTGPVPLSAREMADLARAHADFASMDELRSGWIPRLLATIAARDELLVLVNRDAAACARLLQSTADERDIMREMDAARGQGHTAFESGASVHENPWPHFGPDAHRGDAWDTGWYLGAGNKARERLQALEQAARAVASWDWNGLLHPEFEDSKTALVDLERLASALAKETA
jgi:hypothetical protein